jgi:hypothetical protein
MQAASDCDLQVRVAAIEHCKALLLLLWLVSDLLPRHPRTNYPRYEWKRDGAWESVTRCDDLFLAKAAKFTRASR